MQVLLGGRKRKVGLPLSGACVRERICPSKSCKNFQFPHRLASHHIPHHCKTHLPRSIDSHTESLASSTHLQLRTLAAESTGLPPPSTHLSSQRTACELIPTPQSWPTRDLRTSRRVSRASAAVATSHRACAAMRGSDWEPPRRATSNSCTDEIARPAQIESNYDETTDSFDAMELKPELLRGVYAYGFERPSAIQQRAIMPVIKGA